MVEFRGKQLLRYYKNCLHAITSQTTVKLIAVEKMTSSRYSIRMAREAFLYQKPEQLGQRPKSSERILLIKI